MSGKIRDFLAKHPDCNERTFGWYAVGDSSLVPRLFNGGDIKTQTLDEIVAFLANPQYKPSPDRSKQNGEEKD